MILRVVGPHRSLFYAGTFITSQIVTILESPGEERRTFVFKKAEKKVRK
jgi:hypothetical protein